MTDESESLGKGMYQFLIKSAREIKGIEGAVGENDAIQSSRTALLEKGLSVGRRWFDNFGKLADICPAIVGTGVEN